MTKLAVGDVCRLNKIIPGIYKKDDWKTGLYRVKQIYAPIGQDQNDSRNVIYLFEKVKKDGTVYKTFTNGYRCQAWDQMIEQGDADIVVS